MSQTQVLFGNLRPDGSRGVTVTDDNGLALHGDVGHEASSPARCDQLLTLADVSRLVTMAGRAPSVHNTQPWRFRSAGSVIELLADTSRQLRATDPAGRELLISCGAALYGLRLGMRSLSYLPEVALLPEPARPGLVARVRPVGTTPVTRHESDLLAALPHRHTHRGPFAPGEVPPRLLAGLRLDALLERAELVVIDQPRQLDALTELALAAATEAAASPETADELGAWVRPAGVPASDGIPASARVGWRDCSDMEGKSSSAGAAVAAPAAQAQADAAGRVHRWLPQRDFGRPGTLPRAGYPPSVTAVLMTAGDTRREWVRAGQALHRMLLHAATRWVFANIQSQPLESPAQRAEVRRLLGLEGTPQLLLQFGRANCAPATARRPVAQTLTIAGLAGELGTHG
jgi:hypothetical protein